MSYHRMHINSVDAYETSFTKLDTRKRLVYEILCIYGDMTAREVFHQIQARGVLSTYADMNAVRPRLTELKQGGWIQEVGKTKDITGKMVTVFRALQKHKDR